MDSVCLRFYLELSGLLLLCQTVMNYSLFPYTQNNRQRSILQGYQWKRCEGLQTGDFCGMSPRSCCDGSQCKMFSMFHRGFISCPPQSDHQDCQCIADNSPSNQVPILSRALSTPVCHGIPEGDFCGAAPNQCCPGASCKRFNFFKRKVTSCPAGAVHEDCTCMPDQDSHQISRRSSLPQTYRCPGIHTGGYCGSAPAQCCGGTECQMFSIFHRGYVSCPATADHELCTCRPITLNPFTRSLTHEDPLNPTCEGGLKFGEACGSQPDQCCGQTTCVTVSGDECPPWADNKFCRCV